MKDLSKGHQALFTGLDAATRWDWTRSHPVIRVSFSNGVLKNRAELDQRIREYLNSRWWSSRLIGVEFSKVSRSIVGFEVETLLFK